MAELPHPTQSMILLLSGGVCSESISAVKGIRIKNGSIYNGDIGLVEGVQDSKVYVRLIPRIDLTGASGADKGSKRFVRIPQRINFHPP